VFYILWHVDPLLGNDREISNDMTKMSEELTASSFKVGGKANKQKASSKHLLMYLRNVRKLQQDNMLSDPRR
jgi:hypothetical protein